MIYSLKPSLWLPWGGRGGEGGAARETHQLPVPRCILSSAQCSVPVSPQKPYWLSFLYAKKEKRKEKRILFFFKPQ